MSRKNRIILVAGVSGVGKTTFCKKVTNQIQNAHHLTASSFIRKDEPIDQEKIVSRIVDKANSNSGINIVDGHLVIKGSKIPSSILERLNPMAIIVIASKPDNILSRRLSDEARDRPIERPYKIKRHQDTEIGVAKKIGDLMQIPVIVSNGLYPDQKVDDLIRNRLCIIS